MKTDETCARLQARVGDLEARESALWACWRQVPVNVAGQEKAGAVLAAIQNEDPSALCAALGVGVGDE